MTANGSSSPSAPPSPLWEPQELSCSSVGSPAACTEPHSIAMVTDFFYPSTGGVEHHVYQLARCLKEQGHKVVVVTHRYGTWSGVHRLSGDLKVYYLPLDPMHNGSLPPTAVRLLPHLHDIFVREAVTIVHAHAVCTMSLECIVLASLLGYRVVYTEHSNYSIDDDVVDYLLNRLCRAVLWQADAVIGVSQATRENVLRRCHLESPRLSRELRVDDHTCHSIANILRPVLGDGRTAVSPHEASAPCCLRARRARFI